MMDIKELYYSIALVDTKYCYDIYDVIYEGTLNTLDKDELKSILKSLKVCEKDCQERLKALDK